MNKKICWLLCLVGIFSVYFWSVDAQSTPLRERIKANRMDNNISSDRNIRERLVDRMESRRVSENQPQNFNFADKNKPQTNNLILSQAEKVEFRLDGVERLFYVYRPDVYDENQALPVLMVLHGGKGSAAGMAEKVDLFEEANNFGFIAVYPESFESEWNDGRQATESGVSDLKYLESVAQQLVQNWSADANRIFVSGISSGGNMTQKLACESLNVFAGFSPIASNMPEHLLTNCLNPKSLQPMLLFYGTEDPLMSFDGGESTSPFASKAKGYGEEGYLSSPESITFWAKKKHCKQVSAKLLPDIANDDTRVAQIDFKGCTTPLRSYIVIGGGHTWPGGQNSSRLTEKMVGKTTQDIVAEAIMINYFSLNRR